MSKVGEAAVIMDSYDVQVVATQKKSAGVVLYRTGYVEGDDGHASYVVPAQMYLTPDGARRLRDKLNAWYPADKDPVEVKEDGNK